MIPIPHSAAMHTLAEVNRSLHDSDYRKPVARGLLETMVQSGGYLSPSLVPVVAAFLESLREYGDETATTEMALPAVICELARCIDDSRHYELESYAAEQMKLFRGSVTR